MSIRISLKRDEVIALGTTLINILPFGEERETWTTRELALREILKKIQRKT